jgi:glucose dehydrogenase
VIGLVIATLATLGSVAEFHAAKPDEVAETAAVKRDSSQEQRDWAVWGGAAENTHYSALAQINRSNVKNLAVAWSFDSQEKGGLQTSPIVVEGVLYGITPTQKIFALDATTGKLFWKFDSGIKGTQPDRGLAYWTDGKDQRILVGVMNFVYAIDAITGHPISSFGNQGRIDLRENLGREPAASQSVDLTSPGVVYQELSIRIC